MTKISEQTDIGTALTDDDLILVTNSPGGTPASRKATIGRVKEQVGGLLTALSYDPGTGVNAGATSTSLVELDAVNLAVTFTVPPSGKVLVRLSSFAYVQNSILAWGLLDSSTEIGPCEVLEYNVASNVLTRPMWARVITGLTPGASKTYRFAHARYSGTTAFTRYGGGAGSWGPASMEVWAVPQ